MSDFQIINSRKIIIKKYNIDAICFDWRMFINDKPFVNFHFYNGIDYDLDNKPRTFYERVRNLKLYDL